MKVKPRTPGFILPGTGSMGRFESPGGTWQIQGLAAAQCPGELCSAGGATEQPHSGQGGHSVTGCSHRRGWCQVSGISGAGGAPWLYRSLQGRESGQGASCSLCSLCTQLLGCPLPQQGAQGAWPALSSSTSLTHRLSSG